jgi:hypothetical protein
MCDASPAVPDRAELAWAAGLFDGEGSTMVHTDETRPGYLRLEVCVPQADRDGVPAVLIRFRDAVGGLGRIVGPEDDDLYRWIAGARLEAMAVISLIWDHLGQVKRMQANNCLKLFLSQYDANPASARTGRRVDAVFSVLGRRHADPYDPRRLELAWAAGFIDGEGCFGLVRTKARVRGPRWYKVRASATQRGQPGIIPQVLHRLQSAVGGVGRIERHSGVDAFKWVVEGDARVQTVLESLIPYLGARKITQAHAALGAFRAQSRLKGGDATHCGRGHLYERVAMKGGRKRRICNACERLTDRARRAALGIPPRPFKDLARRYTS